MTTMIDNHNDVNNEGKPQQWRRRKTITTTTMTTNDNDDSGTHIGFQFNWDYWCLQSCRIKFMWWCNDHQNEKKWLHFDYCFIKKKWFLSYLVQNLHGFYKVSMYWCECVKPWKYNQWALINIHEWIDTMVFRRRRRFSLIITY
jgi:hypothetical protein